jgi:ribosomal protein S18 acetylase RimI-like enzyme
MIIDIVPNHPKYFSFIRQLRLDSENIDGFIQQQDFSEADHLKYMDEFGNNYYIALIDNVPVGWVGSVNNDIRIAVHPKYKNIGVGKALISFINKEYPRAYAKIKTNNIASIKLFESCGFKQTFIVMEK